MRALARSPVFVVGAAVFAAACSYDWTVPPTDRGSGGEAGLGGAGSAGAPSAGGGAGVSGASGAAGASASSGAGGASGTSPAGGASGGPGAAGAGAAGASGGGTSGGGGGGAAGEGTSGTGTGGTSVAGAAGNAGTSGGGGGGTSSGGGSGGEPACVASGATTPLGFCGNTDGLRKNAIWPMFGGCPTHAGRSPFVGPQSAPVEAWSIETGGAVVAQPVIDENGIVYFGSQSGTFYAVDPKKVTTADGTTGLVFPAVPPMSATTFGIQASPAIGADGTIFVASSGDEALDAFAPSGQLDWSLALYSGIASSPVVDGTGALYVGLDQLGSLIAVPATAQVVTMPAWSAPASGDWTTVESSPAIGANGVVYVGAGDQALHAIDPTTHDEKWHVAMQGAVLSSPVVATDGTIYVGSYQDGVLHAIRPDSSIAWEHPLGFQLEILSSPVIAADGSIYVVSTKGSLHGFHADGSSIGAPFSDPAIAGTVQGMKASPVIDACGTLYFTLSSSESGVYAVGPDLTLLWSLPRADAAGTPVIGPDGTLYVGIGTRLVALRSP